MSIVNEITRYDQRRDLLINSRNGFTSAANFFVLSGALFMFNYVDNQVDQFRYLCFICLTIGTMASSFYLYNIKEIPLSKSALESEKKYKKFLK